MSRLPSSFPADRAFTLIELLLAMAIGAIVLLVINATFFGALKLRNTTHERIDQDLALQRTLGIIRKDFDGIMLPGGTLSGQFQTTSSSTVMDSSGERVSPDIFTSSGRVDGWSSFSEVQMVSYFLTPAADGGPTKNLVRVVTRNLLPVQEATAEEQTLLPGVSAASITFYDGTEWTDSWDSSTSNTLPTAIKFSLSLASRDHANRNAAGPVELIVPVLVATTTTQQEALASTGQ